MSKAKTFTLIVRSETRKEELLRSADADVLRECGAALAPSTDHGTDLVLVGPRGRTVAEYDIWSSQWRTAA